MKSYNTLAKLLDELHYSHYSSVKLCCKTGNPHNLLPEVDFADTEVATYISAYLAIKEKIR